jgi:SpoVK/Ycf46/Vps4 family AAA+-type ATPase
MSKNIFLDYVLAGYPLLWVSTYEEYRAMTTFARELGASKKQYSYYSWDRAAGLQSYELVKGILKATTFKVEDSIVFKEIDDPLSVLRWAEKDLPEDSILFLKDYHHYAKKDIISRTIRNLIPSFKAQSKVLTILSHTVDIPIEIEKEITVVNFKLPDMDQLRITLKKICEDCSSPGRVVEYPKDDEEILKASLGMTSAEAENAFALSMIEKKKFDPAIICREKAAIVKKTGLLEVIESNLTLEDVGGLETLKGWLEARKDCFSEKAKAFRIDPPKGILLIGVPGTGKSLVAKAIASAWKRPLLRLEMGKVYGSLVGESEGNLRKCLHIAEAVSPCVLFIDELEKAFAGAKTGAGDSGVSRRLFGSFLTWLQEKTADVFLVATANDVQDLPPELLRGGRFDSIFWVDLPEEEQRKEIISIHLSKVGRSANKYNREILVKASQGFSGAEIEVWVKEALVYAFHKGHELQDQDLLDTVTSITPISKLMEQNIKAAKEWADTHGVKYASQKHIKLEQVITNKRQIQL